MLNYQSSPLCWVQSTGSIRNTKMDVVYLEASWTALALTLGLQLIILHSYSIIAVLLPVLYWQYRGKSVTSSNGFSSASAETDFEFEFVREAASMSRSDMIVVSSLIRSQSCLWLHCPREQDILANFTIKFAMQRGYGCCGIALTGALIANQSRHPGWPRLAVWLHTRLWRGPGRN